MQRATVLVGLGLLLVPAAGIAASEAERIASHSGEVIGAATQCGVPDEELASLGVKVIAWARETARDAGELRQAQAAHEAAVRRGAARSRSAGRSGCNATLRSLRELERRAQ